MNVRCCWAGSVCGQSPFLLLLLCRSPFVCWPATRRCRIDVWSTASFSFPWDPNCSVLTISWSLAVVGRITVPCPPLIQLAPFALWCPSIALYLQKFFLGWTKWSRPGRETKIFSFSSEGCGKYGLQMTVLFWNVGRLPFLFSRSHYEHVALTPVWQSSRHPGLILFGHGVVWIERFEVL